MNIKIKIITISIILLIGIFSSCVSKQPTNPVVNETSNSTSNSTNISTSDITIKHFPYKSPITPVPTVNITNISNIINQDITNQSNK